MIIVTQKLFFATPSSSKTLKNSTNCVQIDDGSHGSVNDVGTQKGLQTDL